MKKCLLMVLAVVAGVLFATDAFCWTYEIKGTRLAADTLFVDTIYTDGVKTERVEVPIFQPKTKDEVLTGLKNRGASIERKYQAEQEAIIVKPEVDKDKDKPTPIKASVIEE